MSRSKEKNEIKRKCDRTEKEKKVGAVKKNVNKKKGHISNNINCELNIAREFWQHNTDEEHKQKLLIKPRSQCFMFSVSRYLIFFFIRLLKLLN